MPNVLKSASFRFKLGIAIILFCYMVYGVMWYAWRHELLQEMNDQLWFIGPLWFVGVGLVISGVKKIAKMRLIAVLSVVLVLFGVVFVRYWPIVDGQEVCELTTFNGSSYLMGIGSVLTPCDSQLTIPVILNQVKVFLVVFPVAPIYIFQLDADSPDFRYDDALGRYRTPMWNPTDPYMPEIPIQN